MRGINAELQPYDAMLKQEGLKPLRRNTNPLAYEVAKRRYCKREHRFKTCIDMFISQASYYRLLNKFLRFTKEEYDSAK